MGEQKAREIAQGEVVALESKMEMVYRNLALEKGRVEGNKQHILQWYVECIIFLHFTYSVLCCLFFSYFFILSCGLV